jgi:predicted Zn-dependent peptidase
VLKRLLPALLVALPAAALDHRGEGRKTTARDLAVDLQRYELPNGLVVLLAPDPAGSSVFVSTSFRAGTLYEPRGCSGMAHLVEHILASGPTPETDYAGLLERRGARYFNAHTDFETLQFESIVPAEELPLALWVSADRLGAIPPLVDDAGVERNRRIVLQERALRDVDAPYGLPREKLFSRLFAAPHPLHGSVIGTVSELDQVTAAEVRKFASTLLVPANASHWRVEHTRRASQGLDDAGRLGPILLRCLHVHVQPQSAAIDEILSASFTRRA